MIGSEKIILVALLAAAVGDILPTPADAVYFNRQQRLNEKFDKGEITAKQKWMWDVFYYYALNPLYWLLLAFIVYAIKGDYHFKVKILLVLLAAGLVIGVISRNVKRDTNRSIENLKK